MRFQRKEIYIKKILSSLELRKKSFEKRWDYHPYFVTSNDFSFCAFGDRRACLMAARRYLNNFEFDFRLKRFSVIAATFTHGYISTSELEYLKTIIPQYFVEM